MPVLADWHGAPIFGIIGNERIQNANARLRPSPGAV